MPAQTIEEHAIQTRIEPFLSQHGATECPRVCRGERIYCVIASAASISSELTPGALASAGTAKASDPTRCETVGSRRRVQDPHATIGMQQQRSIRSVSRFAAGTLPRSAGPTTDALPKTPLSRRAYPHTAARHVVTCITRRHRYRPAQAQFCRPLRAPQFSR